MANQESNSGGSIEQELRWLDVDRLDQRLLGLAKELDYNLYALAWPCELDGQKQSDQVDGLIGAVVAHCELLARPIGPAEYGGDGNRWVRLLVASREDEERLKGLLSQSGVRSISRIPYETVYDAKVAPVLTVPPQESPETDLLGERAEGASRGTLNFAYRLKENSLRTIDRGLSSLARFMVNRENRQALHGVLRSIQKLRGLVTMFGLQGASKLAYALEWSLETALHSDETLDDASLEALKGGIGLLPHLVRRVDRGEASAKEIETHIEQLRRLFEPFASRELRLDAPDPNALEAELNLAPALLASASPFERRLLLDAVKRGRKCYTVTIRPSEEILKTGFEPLDLYGMLEVAGDVLLNLPILEEVPDITKYDVNKYYFRFKFIIASDYGPKELEDILATFYELGEIEFELCNRSQVVPDVAPAEDSLAEETSCQTDLMTSMSMGHRVSDDVITDLSGRVDQVSKFALSIAELMHNSPDLPDCMCEMCHDFIRNVGGLRDAMSEIRSRPLSGLMEAIPRTIREVARQRGIVCSVQVEPLGTQIDADLLDVISDPIIDLCVSFIPTAARNAANDGAEIAVSGKEAYHMVTLLITGKKCRALLHNSPVGAILRHLDEILQANFGVADATFGDDALTSCRLRFPTSRRNVAICELHVADQILGVPRSLILDVAGTDELWAVPFPSTERKSPFVTFRAGTNGGSAIVVSIAEKPSEGATVVRLGHGFTRFSLLVDGLGEMRQAISIRDGSSSNRAFSVPFLLETTLDDGRLVPLIDPTGLARHLKLAHGIAGLTDFTE